MTVARWVRYASVLALAGFSGFTVLYSTGITGVTKKPNHVFFEPGCFCHGDTASAAVTVWIEGPDTVAAGQQTLFRLSVARDSVVAAGFNVASFFGPLGIADSAATQLMEPAPGESPELTHVQPRPASGSDTISWEFRYRAPFSAGVVDTLYANGNTVNLTGDPSGDAWAFAPGFLVTIVPVSGAAAPPIAHRYRLHQNHPNPFNPSTTIGYSLPARADVRLAVYDLAGRHVQTLLEESQEAGDHAVSFDAGGLSSGVYLCRLTAESADGITSDARKMVLMK
jgi:hypothetical protein